jgi:lysophospholipase L1-like esterase
VLVLGDSVPGGERTDATAWPERLPTLVGGLGDARGGGRDALPVARPVAEWRDRTADGVHPNETGHAFVARRVAEWINDGE